MTSEVRALPREPHVASTAAALVIGGEILSGKIKDENSFHLAKVLRTLGIELVSIDVLPDRRDLLAARLRQLVGSVDVVVTSGGLGPTHDDVTMAAVADALADRLTENEELIEILRRIYGDAFGPSHRAMALLPSTATLVASRDLKWPLIRSGPIYSLPGVPELFRAKIETLRGVLRGSSAYYGRELLFRIEEVGLKESLDAVVLAHPDVEIGSYPKLFDEAYKTKITFDGRVEAAVADAANDLAARLAEFLIR